MFRRGMTSEEVGKAIAEAVSHASNAATFIAHMTECKEDKTEIKQTLARQDAERQKMHEENFKRFGEINDRIGKISGAIMWRLVVVLGVMLGASYGALYAIFAHKVGL